MPSYKSDKGIWTPAKEDVYVNYADSKFKGNKGRKSHHYNGPDRAAMEQLKEANIDYMGEDVTRNTDNIMRAQQMGLKVEEYLKLNEPLTPAQLKAEQDKKDLVVDHSDPIPKKGVQPQGGGVTKKGGLSDEMPV